MRVAKLLGCMGSILALVVGIISCYGYSQYAAGNISVSVTPTRSNDEIMLVLISSVVFPVIGLIGSLMAPRQVLLGIALMVVGAVGIGAVHLNDPSMLLAAGAVGAGALIVIVLHFGKEGDSGA